MTKEEFLSLWDESKLTPEHVWYWMKNWEEGFVEGFLEGWEEGIESEDRKKVQLLSEEGYTAEGIARILHLPLSVISEYLD